MARDVGLDRLGGLQRLQIGALEVLDELKLVDERRVEVARQLEAPDRPLAGELRRAVAALPGDDPKPRRVVHR